MPKIIQDDIKIVSRYETTDGQLFTKEFDACCHQKELNFDAWYEQDEGANVLGANMANAWVHPDKIRDWIVINQEQIVTFLKDEPEG